MKARRNIHLLFYNFIWKQTKEGHEIILLGICTSYQNDSDRIRNKRNFKKRPEILYLIIEGTLV